MKIIEYQPYILTNNFNFKSKTSKRDIKNKKVKTSKHKRSIKNKI